MINIQCFHLLLQDSVSRCFIFLVTMVMLPLPVFTVTEQRALSVPLLTSCAGAVWEVSLLHIKFIDSWDVPSRRLEMTVFILSCVFCIAMVVGYMFALP